MSHTEEQRCLCTLLQQLPCSTNGIITRRLIQSQTKSRINFLYTCQFAPAWFLYVEILRSGFRACMEILAVIFLRCWTHCIANVSTTHRVFSFATSYKFPQSHREKKMSFQDVGKRNSNRNAATAGFSGANVRSNNTSSQQGSMFGGMSNTFGGSGSVSQISESLTQYQRNVGILEKIAQQLLATGSGRVNNRTELEQQ